MFANSIRTLNFPREGRICNECNVSESGRTLRFPFDTRFLYTACVLALRLSRHSVSYFSSPAFPVYSYSSEIENCEQLLQTGQYQKCIDVAEAAIIKKAYGSEWPLLKAQAELAVGQYVEARQTIDAGLKRYSWSLPLRLLAVQIYQLNNEHEAAAAFLASIHDLASRSAWRYTDASSLVALGRASLMRNADPGEVLESFYDRAIKEYPLPQRRLPCQWNPGAVEK